MGNKIRFMDMQETYNFIWHQHMMGRRLVLPRYGDGEFLIMKGRKKEVATNKPSKELTDLLNKSIKVKGQLICIPMRGMNNEENLTGKNIRTTASKYFVDVSGNDIYGHVQWRMIDVQHSFNFLAEFFVGKTLIVTGNHSECKTAFEVNGVDVDILNGRKTNAFVDYKQLKENLIVNSKNYENIIFALGPVSNILIADIVGVCRSHLIDIGGFLGMLINPYSDDERLVKEWTGIPLRSSKEIIRKTSKTFFKKVKDKIKLYNS